MPPETVIEPDDGVWTKIAAGLLTLSGGLPRVRVTVTVPVEKKAELLPVVRAWRAAVDAARAASGLDAIEAAARESDDAVDEALESLMALRPPTLDALHFQLGERLASASGYTPTNCAGLVHLLHDSDEEIVGAQTYLDLSRLLNKPIAREWDAFDPAMFVRVWEGLPGHYFTHGGTAAFT